MPFDVEPHPVIDGDTYHHGHAIHANGNGREEVTSPSANSTIPFEQFPVETKIYKKRYLVLIMFVALSASNAMQWIQYSIIAHIITEYYGVSFDAVDWTSMVYMVTYMLLVFPGSWFLDKYGLRTSLLIGACGNCLGAWLKLASTSPDRFWLTLTAQTIVGASQVFILGIPPRLAAVWFGPNQVSTACAAGVFGNQLGIALGFVLPPLIVHVGGVDAVTTDLQVMFFGSAVFNTLVFASIVAFFDEKPKLPPSAAQARAIEESLDGNFLQDLRQLLSNVPYLLLVFTYGLNVGVFYAVSTLLSQMVLFFYPDAQEEVGTIGLLLVFAGMLGSVVCGYVLDKFHHFKLTTLFVYFFSFVGMLAYTLTIDAGELWIVYVMAFLLGFFMTGYLPIGFEFAAELTFPIAEGTTSGLLNAAAQVFGVLLTMGMGRVMKDVSIWWCNILMSAVLLFGTFLTACIKSDLRRQNAHRDISYAVPRSDTQLTETSCGI